MLDYIAIFRRLNEARVRYLVVGGMAVNLHGIPRMTYDLDLMLDLEDENLERFLTLVKKWGFKPKVPVDIMDLAVAEKREDWIHNKNMLAFNLVNTDWAISEIDILICTPFSFSQAAADAKLFDLNGVEIPTVSVEHLIRMKKDTGREQDSSDVEYLKKIVGK